MTIPNPIIPEAPMANAIDDVKEWVVVPKEPTDVMLDAAFDVYQIGSPFSSGREMREATYRAMLAAAPSPAPSQHTGWSDTKTDSRMLMRLLGAAYDDAAKAGLPGRNRALWEEIWVVASRPWVTPSEEFSAWLNEGPKLAAAANCHVGIKVTEAKPTQVQS